MRRFALLVYLMFFFLVSTGQVVYKKGYILRLEGDTTRGMLKEVEEERRLDGIFFRDGKGSENFLDKKVIKGFGFDEGDTYELVSITNSYDSSIAREIFAKSLVKGSSDLLMFYKNSNKFFVARGTNDSVYLMSGDTKTSNGELVVKGNYLGTLNFLSVQCENIRSKVEQVNYSEADMISFFLQLNKCLDPGRASIVLYKRARMDKAFWVFGAGIPLGERYEFTGQLIVRFVLPTVNRKVSLNTGLGFWYLMVEKEEKNGSMYNHVIQYVGIPITLQYNFTNGIVQPYFFGGLSMIYQKEKSVYFTNPNALKSRLGFSFAIGGGVEGYLNKHWILKAEARYEQLFHFPVIGIAYKF